MKVFRYRFIVSAWVLASSLAFGQAPEDDPKLKATLDRVHARAVELFKKSDLPGLSVSFALADGKIGSAVVGYSDVESNTDLTPQDRFLAGSVGKTYVAALAMKMVENRKLRLDDKVSKYLGREDWFKLVPNYNTVTVRHLMSHTSGIPEHVMSDRFLRDLKANPDKQWTAAELMGYVANAKPLAGAGDKFEYADTNYVLVGAVIEKISGIPLFRMIQDEILVPLGLRATAPQQGRNIAGLATGYMNTNSPFGIFGKIMDQGRLAFDVQAEYAGGGIVTNPTDLVAWAKHLYEGTYIRPKSVAEMTTAGKGDSRVGGGYGIGTQIRETPLGLTWGHGGWFPGYMTEMVYFPDKKVAIAVQFNTDDARKSRGNAFRYILDFAKIILES